MTNTTRARIPQHLSKYIVDQNYARYTAQDQSVWRYVMRQLKNFLSQHAHASYLEGLRQSGLEVDKIPRIDEIDQHLETFGWGAVPVSGFIPPAAFMEFQAIGVLPIASDMRTIDHLLYTPAPDIVHEAAGHAPILCDPAYSAYLRQYGEVARHAILNQDDLAQYAAIRLLSDLKEDPQTTPTDIEVAERALAQINQSMGKPSEAALLSRMNWWTAEYGLIGDLKDPRIFGAGLLSSVGESRACLRSVVKKIPLSVDCVNYSYDITEQQPQLFVTEDFSHLRTVLEQLAAQLAYRQGGASGLDRAVDARTVNSVELNSGVQISGVLNNYLRASDGSPTYLQFSGPSQLSYHYHEFAHQGVGQHPHGFSTPVGLIKNQGRCLSTFSPSDLERLGLKRGERAVLTFDSGVRVDGKVSAWTYHAETLAIISWVDCSVTMGSQQLFDPAWGTYDMAVGTTVASVFGGPADRAHYGDTDDFVAKTIPPKKYSPEQVQSHKFFERLRDLRRAPENSHARANFSALLENYLDSPNHDWLKGVELLELSFRLQEPEEVRARILPTLNSTQECVRDGVTLASVSL